ncbi:hypothetical protein ACOSP7_012444 [Xanthoceras sorbifolium]
MNPKISYFGLARIFEKNDLEANTERIYVIFRCSGYAPPEYVKECIYSTKSDVYSFGVLLLQIISGKKVCIFYGDNKNLSLLEYLVLCLAYSGYAWTLVNPKENGIGAASTGPALTGSGYVLSKDVIDYIERYEAKLMYNATYVMNYCTINGTMWIGFDDVELVQTKVSYA